MIRMTRAGARRAFVTLSVLLLAGVLTLTPVSNNDIFLHLKTGSLILERGTVPWVDEYTYTRAGAPYIAHEWLAQVLFVAAHRIGGLGLLALILWLSTVATLWLVHAATARRIRSGASGPLEDRSLAIAALTICATLILMTTSLSTRPHMFSFLLVAAFGWLLPRLESAGARGRRAVIAVLIVLQLLWVNLHGAFVLGILLAGLRAAGETIRRRRLSATAAILPALLAVTFMNPYGWRIYELVWRFRDPFFREAIVEWQTPFDARFAASPLFWLYLIWSGLALAAAARAARASDYTSVLTVGVFTILSSLSRRHITLLALATAPLIGEALSAWTSRLRVRRRAGGSRACWITGGAVAALGILIAVGRPPVLGAMFPRPGIGIAGNIPVEALRVMRAESLEGRVFTTLGFGAYVTYAAWPRLLTNVDSRLEVFGGAVLRRSMLATRRAVDFRETFARERFDFALLSWRWPSMRGALEVLSSDPDWALIYFDDLAALYARRAPGRESLLERRAYRVIDPARFMTTRGLGPGVDPVAAETEARRAVGEPRPGPGRPPMNTIARLILASAQLFQQRFEAAAVVLGGLIAEDPGLTPAYELLARAQLAAGDEEGARSTLVRLRRIAQDPEAVDRVLRAIGDRDAP